MSSEVRLTLTIPASMAGALNRTAEQQDCRIDEVVYRALRNYLTSTGIRFCQDEGIGKELQDALEFRARYCLEFKPEAACAGMQVARYRPGQYWLSFQDGRQVKLWLVDGES